PDMPERLGRWRLRREIGRGGMGRVFDAVDDEGHRAAVKVVHAHLLAVPGTVERFLREAEAGRRLDHPRVVRTLDAGRTSVLGGETPWIALEHVEGRNVRQLLVETGAFGERLARAIGQGVAEALAAVHGAGLVHRDVKPENVLVTPREEVRLTDLGLALVRDAAVRLSGTGDFVGTLLYAAPEQLKGQSVGPAADLYALGVLLYELVAGRHPGTVAPAASPFAAPTPSPLRGVADVSPFFEAVVNGLLEPAPAQRLGDAARVAAILRDGESSAWWRAKEAERGSARRPAVDRTVPLLGRATEMAHLEDAWASALQGAGRVLLIEAEAGLGKSRLVSEWLDRVERSGVTGLRTAFADHARADADAEVPPLSSALRDVLGPGDLEARLAVLLDEGGRLARPFAEWIDGRAAPGTPPLPDASQATAHRLLLRGLAREGPLVVVAEDLDEATDASRRLFLALARAVAGERVVLVGTASPGLPRDFLEALRALPSAQVIGLDPLGRDEAHDLFLAAVGGASSTAPWHDAVRGAGGNPLCLIEWARAARTSPAGLPAQPVPDVLRRLLEQRVAALDPESAHLLAVAACAGERFDPSVVSAAAGAGRLEGLRRLHRLDRDHRLVVADGEAYRFRHAVLRSIVHDDLPPALRAEIHGALARALEATPPGPSPGAWAAAIVHHALAGPDPRDAFPHAEEAIEFLTEAHRARDVAAVCESLLALGDAPGPRLAAMAWVHLGASRVLTAPTDAVVPVLERGFALAQALPDDALALRAALELGAALGQAGRLQESLAWQRLGQELAERRGTLTARVSAAIGLAAAFLDLGRISEAGEAAALAETLARESGEPLAQARAAYFVGAVRLDTGDAAAARRELEASVRGSRAYGDSILETSAVTALSKADFLEGRFDAVREHLDRLIAIAREQGEFRAELVTRVNLASLDLSLGRPAEARETALGVLAAAQPGGLGAIAVHARAVLAWACVQVGAWDEAERAFDEVVAEAAVMGSPVVEAKIAGRRLALLAWSGRFEEAEALHAEHAPRAAEAGTLRERLALDEGLAEVHVARGDPSAAAVLLERALAEGTPHGLAQEAARWSLALGICRRDMGDADAARPLLDRAREDGDRMGMRDVSGLARMHLATLPGAERVLGRVALTEYGASMGVHPRLRAVAALAAVTGEPALQVAAARDLDRLVASLPEARRVPMLARVPLHRSLRPSP
ncbi:MAG TPA: protein kinase, partial [Planctomycetota bacterium]|nr:protein kinase [Planctomycetota bacterium]